MSANIWIIDDDAAIRFILEDSLQQWGYRPQSYFNGEEVLEALQTQVAPQLIISDIRMPGIDGLTLLSKVREQHPNLPCLITTAYSNLDSTVSAYLTGAFDYLPKPFDLAELKQRIEQALRPSLSQPNQPSPTTPSFDRDIIGQSPMMQQLYRAIGRLAKTKVNVLISGETGTGKELIARALHKHSPVAKGEFVALNMAAIPAELAEAELFGHEKGAFTGAAQSRQGRFAQADNGTLFLDEIGDMPLPLQAKLLRALAEGSYYPIGGQTLKHANARIIAASHKNLAQLVSEGLFREDLYYRLNVIRLDLPPLRERGEDIPALLDFHLERAAKQHHLSRKNLTQAARQKLTHYHWPGNIRELENLCQQLTIMSPTDTIDIQDLPTLMTNRNPSLSNTAVASTNWQQALTKTVEQALSENQPQLYQHLQSEFDHVLIETALKHTQFHKQLAAQKLNIGRNTLTRKYQSQASN
ncbi:nitrogen regulation protein NR(I) [Suttonella ornithocola]|uniref:DNA-binding transcriptional regulator NtrC n=1 Tax=Suttonella ornithocola TaxID=279832 RepID=A0A380MMD1_9GAMM|nr:nitrogen regulation protein NR(I) [Suttonella ornithocola]SUO93053.1 Nitrogen regulation protein NR(I) [Suttonella ornithocola]